MGDKVVEREILDFTTKLKFRQVEGSLPCAKQTAVILRHVITTKKHSDGSSLLDDIRNITVRLQQSKPMEVSIGNMARRILRLVRDEMVALGEEYEGSCKKQVDEQKGQVRALHQRAMSLRNLLDQPVVEEDGNTSGSSQREGESEKEVAQIEQKRLKKASWKGKQDVIDGVNELFQELDNVDSCISQQAVEHIHANEVVLTLGASNTVFEFLVEGRKKRDFVVVVAECAPSCSGHRQAKRLASAGIQTTVISDAAVYSVMARVNKVLVGAHAVLANGGMIGAIGTHLLSLSAKQHAVPFVVLVGLQKLSPLFPHDPYMMFNDFKLSSDVVDYDVQAEFFDWQCQQENDTNEISLQIPNPGHDYVPPELISLLVTDGGGFIPQYVYRLLAEYYNREDYILNKELLDTITF